MTTRTCLTWMAERLLEIGGWILDRVLGPIPTVEPVVEVERLLQQQALTWPEIRDRLKYMDESSIRGALHIGLSRGKFTMHGFTYRLSAPN